MSEHSTAVGWCICGGYHNACLEPCDNEDGPCVCGAWHNLIEVAQRKLNKKTPSDELGANHDDKLTQVKQPNT